MRPRPKAGEDPEAPAASWRRARRHYHRLARQADLRHLAGMELVVSFFTSRGYDRHFFAYTLPDFLAISTACAPEESLETPFLSVSVDRGHVFELCLVSPAAGADVVSVRTPGAGLFHELDSSMTALVELLVEKGQEEG